MLVFTRKVGETVVVDGPATFKIDGVDGGHVRVSIDADRTVAVDRGEVAEEKRRDREQRRRAVGSAA